MEMRPIAVINIEIKGPVQTGKSAVMASVKQMLEAEGYCVAIPERGERNNPSSPIKDAASHEQPKRDRTVFILTEDN